jgi:hypothetical protein
MSTKKAPAKQSHPSLSLPTAKEVKEAQETSEVYRVSGESSNRTDWARQAVILAAVYAVTRRGVAVELPAVPGNSPVYNRAWRVVRSACSPEEWAEVRVCAVHAGEFTTTAKTGKAYLVPADMTTRGLAPKGW